MTPRSPAGQPLTLSVVIYNSLKMTEFSVFHSCLRGEERTYHRKCGLFLKDTGLHTAASAGMILGGQERNNTLGLPSECRQRSKGEGDGEVKTHREKEAFSLLPSPQKGPVLCALSLGPSAVHTGLLYTPCTPVLTHCFIPLSLSIWCSVNSPSLMARVWLFFSLNQIFSPFVPLTTPAGTRASCCSQRTRTSPLVLWLKPSTEGQLPHGCTAPNSASAPGPHLFLISSHSGLTAHHWAFHDNDLFPGNPIFSLPLSLDI